MNMVNWHPESRMDFFDRMPGRGLGVFPRITDDQCEWHIQHNAGMYHHDKIIADGVKYGLESVIGQLNKERGAEASLRYILDGSWNTNITPQSFYELYLTRLYGPAALNVLRRAFSLLEENERALGWHGKSVIFSTFCGWTGSHRVALRRVKHEDERPSLEYEDWEIRVGLKARGEVSETLSAEEIEDLSRRYGGNGPQRPGFVNLHGGTFRKLSSRGELKDFYLARARDYRGALDLLLEARGATLPGALEELDYVIFKTENFIHVLDMLAVCQAVVINYEHALVAMSQGAQAESLVLLLKSRESLDRALRMARMVLGQMTAYADVPSERHQLYLGNTIIPSLEAEGEYLSEVITARRRFCRAQTLTRCRIIAEGRDCG
jgi:hypothetical protein